jgi:hypothetical protein
VTKVSGYRNVVHKASCPHCEPRTERSPRITSSSNPLTQAGRINRWPLLDGGWGDRCGQMRDASLDASAHSLGCPQSRTDRKPRSNQVLRQPPKPQPDLHRARLSARSPTTRDHRALPLRSGTYRSWSSGGEVGGDRFRQSDVHRTAPFGWVFVTMYAPAMPRRRRWIGRWTVGAACRAESRA